MSQRFFEDAEHAAIYAKYRPNAPPQLAQTILSFLRQKYQGELELCCDVGCGNGQCSALFSTLFDKVLATDISTAQVEMAKKMDHPKNVQFQVSAAEKIPAEDGSVQLVVACMAAHWFDLPAFFKEAERALCDNGIVAIAAFFLPIMVHSDPTTSYGLNKALEDFFYISLDPYWGSGVRHLQNEYGDISIPYKETVRDCVWTEEQPHTLADLVAYLETWSGYQNLCRAKGDSAGQEVIQNFVTKCQKALQTNDDPADVALILKRKYFLLMGRKI